MKRGIQVCALVVLWCGVCAGCHMEDEEQGAPTEGARTVTSSLHDSDVARARLIKGETRGVLLSFDKEELARHRMTLEGLTRTLGEDGKLRTQTLGAFGMVSVSSRGLVDVQQLERLPGLLHVYEDIEVTTQLSSVLPWINQPVAAQAGHIGTGVGVVVLDTGVDWSHADFGSCVAPGASGCRVVHAQDFAPDDGARDEDGHGTNVAAIVAGVAPGAKIVALDVFDGGVAKSSTILAALNWVVMNRATYDIGVVNMSLGSGYYRSACGGTVFSSAMQTLRQHGIVAVASSGNDGFTDGLGVPACDPDVVSVGAVYDRDIGGVLYSSCADATTAADQVACFSNTSSFLDVLAPGVSISGGGWTMSGTSQAAPVVSGALAALTAAYPAESVVERVARLRRSASITDARTGDRFARLDMAALFDEPCTYTHTPVTSLQQGSGSGVVEVDVTTADHCAWSVQTTQGWAVVDESPRFGSARVEVRLGENLDTSARQVEVVYEGGRVTITQEGQPVVVPEPAELIEVRGVLSVNWWRRAARVRYVPLFVVASAVEGSALAQMCVDVVKQGEAPGECTAWAPYRNYRMVTLPDEDAMYTVHVWFKDEFGVESASAMTAEMTLDRVAPQDGTVALTQTSYGWRVIFGAASDAGTGVAIYRVYAREGRAPAGCFGLPWDRLVHEARSAGDAHVIMPVSGGGEMFFRVCAYDGAGNVSRGVKVSTLDTYGL